MDIKFEGTFHVLYFINVVHSDSNELVFLFWFYLEVELTLFLCDAEEAKGNFLTGIKHFHWSTLLLRGSILNLEAILYDKLVLEDANHLAQFLIFQTVLQNGFSKLLDSSIFATDLVLQLDDLFAQPMLVVILFVQLRLYIELVILVF